MKTVKYKRCVSVEKACKLMWLSCCKKYRQNKHSELFRELADLYYDDWSWYKRNLKKMRKIHKIINTKKWISMVNKAKKENNYDIL